MPSKTNSNSKPAAKICASQNDNDILKDVVVITTQSQDAMKKAVSAVAPGNGNATDNPECSHDGPRAALGNRFVSAGRNGKESVIMNNGNDSRVGLDSVPALSKALGMALETAPTKMLKVDVEKYQTWLDDTALSEEQKGQILEALWKIVLCFVDLGFGVSPLQEACGQLSESEGFCGHAGQDVVSSGASTLSSTFNKIAAE